MYDISAFAEMKHSVKKLCEREIPPYQHDSHYNSVPRDLFKRFADLGLCGLQVSDRYGGLGVTPDVYSSLIEEVAKVDLGPAIFLCVHNMVAGMIERFGSTAQKESLLPRMTSGEYLGAFALTEPSAGSDASALKTLASTTATGYQLNGQKCYITSAGFANVYAVFARWKSGPHDGKLGAFLIDVGLKPSQDPLPGFKISPPEKKMGCELSPIASLFFENLELPSSSLLGDPTQGYSIALSGLAGGRISIAACANGISRAALDKSLQHLHEREQFQHKLIDFQGLQFMLADMQMKYEAAKQLTLEAARLVRDDPNSPDNRLYPSYAKCFATDAAMSITTDAVQILGGAGYIKDYGVEKLMRDAKMLQIVEGTNQIQRMVIARELSKRYLLKG